MWLWRGRNAICKQDKAIFYESIIIFLLSTMTLKYQNEICSMLQRVRAILKEFSQRKGTEGDELQYKISALKTQLGEGLDSSQKIVKSMIACEQSEQFLIGLLWRKLRETRSAEQIWAQCNELKRRSGEHYNLANHALQSLIKDVVENSRLIEEELRNLGQNLKRMSQAGEGEVAPGGVPLWTLLKMVMEDTAPEFDEQMSELLFRAYILQESISLVLLKTRRIFQQICERLDDEQGSDRQSSTSQKTGKRSALSQSIQVFKRNQLRQEMERCEPAGFGSPSKESQIQTDYKMTRKAERAIRKVETRLNCCF